MKTIIFYLFISSLFFAGCFSYKIVSDSRRYPKNPNFSIFPNDQLEQLESLIDFSAIYYKYDFAYWPDGTKIDGYNFMRFWPSGHVYMRVADHIPSREDAENFRTAYMGFYEISGTNLVIEQFVPNWGYIKSWGTISSNAIHEYKIERRDGGRCWQYPKDYTYIRHPIDGLSREPDWTPFFMIEE